MAQTKADRQAAAKKGAATRERNRTREESQERGTKAAATRQGNEAAADVEQAKQSARSAGGGLKSAARSIGDAAKQAWLYVTILTVGYMVSRGLAKSGSSQPYDEDRS